MTLEFYLVTNLKTTCTIVNLYIGLVAYDLDDLGHHTDITAIYVAYLILAHRTINLRDNDV